MKHTLWTPPSVRNINSSLNSREVLQAQLVEHRGIVIAAKKWDKLNQREKLLEKRLREKALISERGEKFLRAGSLTRFCSRQLSFR